MVTSLLPLNEEYTQINLHISHTNEQPFYHDNSIKQGLLNFESAIHAALRGDTSSYIPSKPKALIKNRLLNIIQTAGAIIVGPFLLKKSL